MLQSKFSLLWKTFVLTVLLAYAGQLFGLWKAPGAEVWFIIFLKLFYLGIALSGAFLLVRGLGFWKPEGAGHGLPDASKARNRQNRPCKEPHRPL